ncbi:phosphoribosylanthranilate isomerase [Fulvivirga ligni]|uniref:phosphoribosylanthranilate isomerase n=1 Tax=Fulvivirga ligni TaxID=2904246 RepID=UPI001F218D93|nr:phosphoribosylanthranilate isomerase [Fulvivirga ligni]UII19372.1 phosphoribosylanthranilate isomerase [Fulvivirga ligni]
MALSTFVKVSSVNNLSDARYCAGMEVNLIGFNLEKEAHGYIAPDTFKELIEWLSGVEYVGEFDNYTATQIIETVKDYDLAYIQINNAELVEELQVLNTPIILNVDPATLEGLSSDLNIEYLMVGSSKEEWSEDEKTTIKKYSGSYQLLISSGINENNIADLLEETGAKGIALQGGDELRPGYKDYDELADILESLEVDEFI